MFLGLRVRTQEGVEPSQSLSEWVRIAQVVRVVSMVHWLACARVRRYLDGSNPLSDSCHIFLFHQRRLDTKHADIKKKFRLPDDLLDRCPTCYPGVARLKVDPW